MVYLDVLNSESNFRRVALTRTAVVGRAAGCQLRIASRRISRRHCEIILEPDTVRIRDLNSSNQTIVNGRPLVPGVVFELSDGDEILLGSVRLRLDAGGSVASDVVPVEEASGNPDHTSDDSESEPELHESLAAAAGGVAAIAAAAGLTEAAEESADEESEAAATPAPADGDPSQEDDAFGATMMMDLGAEADDPEVEPASAVFEDDALELSDPSADESASAVTSDSIDALALDEESDALSSAADGDAAGEDSIALDDSDLDELGLSGIELEPESEPQSTALDDDLEDGSIVLDESDLDDLDAESVVLSEPTADDPVVVGDSGETVVSGPAESSGEFEVVDLGDADGEESGEIALVDDAAADDSAEMLVLDGDDSSEEIAVASDETAEANEGVDDESILDFLSDD